eukprot:15480965-Alexandrium_andersonii.AAC.1
MRANFYQPLDLEAQPQGYRLWKSKARGSLLGKFPQVGQLLDWAEKQLEPIGAPSQQSTARLAPGFDVAQASGV